MDSNSPLYDEPGLQDATVSDFLLPFLLSGGAKGLSNLPEQAQGAMSTLKGLGNAGSVSLGGTPEAAQGAKAVSQGLRALLTPEELTETMAVGMKPAFGTDLVEELAGKLENAEAGDVVTLSNGSKWKLHGVQKGIPGKVPDNPLLEHVSGPKPDSMKGLTTTTSLTALRDAAEDAMPPATVTKNLKESMK